MRPNLPLKVFVSPYHLCYTIVLSAFCVTHIIRGKGKLDERRQAVIALFLIISTLSFFYRFFFILLLPYVSSCCSNIERALKKCRTGTAGQRLILLDDITLSRHVPTTCLRPRLKPKESLTHVSLLNFFLSISCLLDLYNFPISSWMFGSVLLARKACKHISIIDANV